ncbi:transposase [Carboxylicivirga sp. M1479]|nr:transposase [Carboxylicivirga sp. M1479]
MCDTNQIIIKRDLIQDAFTTIRRTFEAHRDTIINYFNGRSTNAAAESFNAKIKEFRRQFRGVSDVKFFLYRLCKIYA